MLAADRGTLDAHTARYSLAARGGGSCPTDEGMRTFPRTAPGEDIIADRLGGQNRWPLTRDKSARLAGCRRRGPARSGDSVRMLAWTRRRRVMDSRHGSRRVRGMAASAVGSLAPPLLLAVVREAQHPYGQGPRLLDRVRERIRTRHYSRRTEKAYIAGSAATSCFTAGGIPGRWVRRSSRASSLRSRSARR